MLLKLCLILSWQLLWPTPGLASEDVSVCVPDLGCIRGTQMPGFQTETFEAFLGIPYAKPPVGELRFKNPEPAPAWPVDHEIDATKPKADCLQKNYLAPGWPITGDEDCLYLNLYRPVNATGRSLPVLFYIHGGAFFCGSPHPSALGPEYFMDTGEVIFIAIAYRLGPFGFLATGDEVMPGNFGLKDQKMALKWVQKHVAAFGGDPNTVMILGHSAGASATHFHLMSEASKGLFHRVVSSSGNAIAPYVAIQRQPLEQTRQLAQFAGISDAHELNSNELIHKLQAVDGVDILNAGHSFRSWHLTPLTIFRPNIEDATWPNAFITEDPDDQMKRGNFPPMPWLMGFAANKGEGAALTLGIIANERLRGEFNRDFDAMFTKMLELPPEVRPEDAKKLMESILAEYMNGEHELNNSTSTGFMEFFSDIAFYHPSYKAIEYFLNYSDPQTNPLYLLKFNYRGPHSYSVVYTGGSLNDHGVVHYDDMLYLFRTPALFPEDYEKDSKDARLVKIMVGLYIEFAKHGHLEAARPCEKFQFVSNPNGICDYLSIVNDGDSFKIDTDNRYNLGRMKFLDSFL